MRQTLEEERRALASFVAKFDTLGLGMAVAASKINPPKPTPGGAMTAYERRQSRNFSGSAMRLPRISDVTVTQDFTGNSETSPIRFDRARARAQPSLLDQDMPEDVVVADVSFDEMEVERQLLETSICVHPGSGGMAKLLGGGGIASKTRDIFGDKENILP